MEIMFRKKIKDVILVARPDHSIDIYKSLCEQKFITFLFLTFKVIPRWLDSFFPNKKITVVRSCCKISLLTTIFNVLKYTYNISILRSVDVDCLLGWKLRRIMYTNSCRILHYWPSYCYKEIKRCMELNPKLITIVDVHMPNPIIIAEEMKPIYNKYNLEWNNANVERYSSAVGKHLENAQNILVPSSYVMETFKVNFPEKNYIIIPYGITVYDKYVKKEVPNQINSFVYVGTISLEKGCDILLDWFSKHQELELHLFGKVLYSQQSLFSEYKAFNNIKFHGSIAKKEIQKHVVKYNIGIHLSRFDAYSLAVGEVIGVGNPVIVSDKTGNKDDIKKYGFGEITNLDFDSISKAIAKVIRNYYQYIENIDNYICSNPVSYGDKIVSLYKTMLD